MSGTTENIYLLRGHKTRLLRAPLRLPWETDTIPLGASPRFLPALVRIRTGRGDVEVRLGPGEPLSKTLKKQTINKTKVVKISYADGILLGGAALFSIFLSDAALTALARGTKLAEEYLSGVLGMNLSRSIASRGDFSVFADASGGAVDSPGHDGNAEMAFEAWLEHFGPLQKELIRVLAKYKTDKRWRPNKRPRELVRAFRVDNITVYPELCAEKKKEIESWLGEHLGVEECRLTRPYKRGYAKTHGGLARKIRKAKRKDEAEEPVEALIFSDCKIGNRPLFYSDLGSHLERYVLADKAGGSGATKAMVDLAGGGDFIRMPLLWWGPDHRPGYPHVQFYSDATRGSRVLRATLISIFGLLFDAAAQGLRSSGGSSNKKHLGDARLLFEAALAYLYYALLGKDVALRTEAVVSIAEYFILVARGSGSWEKMSVLLDDHSWGGHWTLAETAVFASRAPLPLWYLRKIHDSPSGFRLWSDIKQLRERFKKVGLYE